MLANPPRHPPTLPDRSRNMNHIRATRSLYLLYYAVKAGAHICFAVLLNNHFRGLISTESIEQSEFSFVFAYLIISAVSAISECHRIASELVRYCCPRLKRKRTSTYNYEYERCTFILGLCILIVMYALAVVAAVFVWSWVVQFNVNGDKDEVRLWRESRALFGMIIASLALSVISFVIWIKENRRTVEGLLSDIHLPRRNYFTRNEDDGGSQ